MGFTWCLSCPSAALPGFLQGGRCHVPALLSTAGIRVPGLPAAAVPSPRAFQVTSGLFLGSRQRAQTRRFSSVCQGHCGSPSECWAILCWSHVVADCIPAWPFPFRVRRGSLVTAPRICSVDLKSSFSSFQASALGLSGQWVFLSLFTEVVVFLAISLLVVLSDLLPGPRVTDWASHGGCSLTLPLSDGRQCSRSGAAVGGAGRSRPGLRGPPPVMR